MYCLKCGYNLFGLSEARCPECGHAFDWADDRTFAGQSRRHERIPLKVPLLCSVYPLVLALALTMTWLVAGFQLGHDPIPSADDPKQLTGFAKGCYLFTLVLLRRIHALDLFHAGSAFLLSHSWARA